MANGYLTTHEFERWQKEDREFKREMRLGMQSLIDRDIRQGERITVVETKLAETDKAAKSTSVKWSAGLTTALTVLIQAALAAFGWTGK